MSIQAPPNLARGTLGHFIAAGINDWGGISPVTRDFINPEAPWPHIESLRQTCALEGYTLEARLPVYPEYLDWMDPGLQAAVQKNAERIGHVAA